MRENKRRYILLTPDLEKMLKPYDNRQIGIIFSSMMRYVKNGEDDDIKNIPERVWQRFKDYIDTQDKYLRHEGERHWNWKGGITPENAKIRSSSEYAKWRKAVFERDHFTCQMCGRYGCKLNAHHIRPFSKYPEYRLDIDNGITLCKDCHKKAHKKVK